MDALGYLPAYLGAPRTYAAIFSTLLCGFLVVLFLSIRARRSTTSPIAAAQSSQNAFSAPGFIIYNQVFHTRLLPEQSKHTFKYPILHFLVSLAALEDRLLDLGHGWLFGYGGVSCRVTGLRPSAYMQAANGPEDSVSSLRVKLKKLLLDSGYNDTLADAWMLTMPSYLGFEGINPLTVYFCYRNNDDPAPWAVCLEIHNTFGERHAHVLEMGVHEDPSPAKGYQHQWTFPRGFHVSPFNDRSGYYTVSVTLPPFGPSRIPSTTEINADNLLHPRICIRLLSSNPDASMSNGSRTGKELKLLAAMHPTAVVPLTSSNLLQVLIKYPIVLFLSLPRILYHAWILHYLKHLPIYPRPEPLSFSYLSAEPNRTSTGRGIGIGWQPATYLQLLAKARVQEFLQRRVREMGISVELVSGDPTAPRAYFPHSNVSAEDTDGREILSITYSSPAFFTLLLEAPSAQHALAYNRAGMLFSTTSSDLFLRVFCTRSRSAGNASHISFNISLAQRLRRYTMPSTLCEHPDFQCTPPRHPIDPEGGITSAYIFTIALLLISWWTNTIEKRLYQLFRVRFVSGKEPWRQWEEAGEYSRIRSPST